MTSNPQADEALDRKIAEALDAFPTETATLSRAVLSQLAEGGPPHRLPLSNSFPLGLTGGALLLAAAAAGYAVLPLIGSFELALLILSTGGL
jgi:hypothetical protein